MHHVVFDWRDLVRESHSFIDPRIRSCAPQRSAEQSSFYSKFESSDGCTDRLLKANDEASVATILVVQFKLSVTVIQ